MSAKITMKSGQEIKESLLAEIESFNSELEEARTEFKSKFDKKREAIKEKLDPELNRLKAEFKAFAKHYEEFTGKVVKFSVGGETMNGASGKPDNKRKVLELLKDGVARTSTEIADALVATYPGVVKKGSVMAGMTNYKSERLIEDAKTDKGPGGWKITQAGLDWLAKH